MDRKTQVELRKKYIEQGYNKNQIECLMEGHLKGVDVSLCENPEFFSLQMSQILQGLLAKVDVSVYAKTEYDWFQMEEIRKGLERNLDVTSYLDPTMDFRTMRELRKGLEENLDLTRFKTLEPGDIRQLRKAMVSKVNILEDINQGYDAQQLDEIRQGLEKGIRVQPFITPEFRARAIREVVQGLEEGIDVSLYAKIIYSWKQMKELRLGIEHRVDISKYSHRLYSHEQMEEIRLGLEQGLEVDSYLSFMYTAKEMRKIRMRLLKDCGNASAETESSARESNNEAISLFANAKKLGDLEVEISEDGMEAYIDLSQKTSKWNQADILKTLYLKGVRKGILTENMGLLLADTTPSKKLLIAVGLHPENGVDGYYEYFFRTEVAEENKTLPDSDLDYQNLDWYEEVKKGQKLVEYHAATSGKDGYTVGGKTVPAQKGKELPILKGRGFITGENQNIYFASQDGKITYSSEGIWVVDIHILQNVTSVRGEQFYDGMVIVKGSVGNDVKLEASDDIVVENFIESAYLKSGGNILVRQGMNAGNIGGVDAKKMVLGKYFEDANIHAGTRLQADYCMNCNILTEGKTILLGETGALIGGQCKAQEGVLMKSAGNRASIPTFISIGVGEELRKLQDKIKEDIDRVVEDLDKLKKARQELIDKYPAEVRNTMDVYLKIGSAVFTKNQQLKGMMDRQQELKKRVAQVQYAGIRVMGDIYDNVSVEIGQARWNSKGVKNVTLKAINEKVSVYQH